MDISEITQPELNGKAYCFYRLPDEKQIYLCSGVVLSLHNESFPQHAFIISPFIPTGQAYYINPENWGTISPDYFNSINTVPIYNKPGQLALESKEHYCEIVAKGTKSISSGAMSKVVLSHIIDVLHSKDDSFTLPYFYKLTESYPNAFVYLLSSPQTGTWIGCSPEVLLSATHDQFTTMSLAGTKKIPQMAGANDQDLFTQKEIDEQAWVTNYVMEKLAAYSDNLEAGSPELKQAGNLYHLVTHFKGSLKEGKTYGELISRLHPTPAICGTPTDRALSFILANEGYNRELYSGYLGPVMKNKADIFVNLRCMQIMENNMLRLYAGAGIVKDSIPEDEWEETKNKMNTLLSVFYSL